jgi:hypothetical protein
MNRIRQAAHLVAMMAVLLVLITAETVQAQVVVSPTVTPNGNLFHYDYSVTNNTGNDLLLVDVQVLTDPLTIQNLMAPSGFQIAYDSGLGLLTFLEDSSLFGTAPVSGFTFDSSVKPSFTTFAGLVLDGNGGFIHVSGNTLGPVPEPGSLTLLCALGSGGIVWIRRRKREQGIGETLPTRHPNTLMP